MDNLILQALSNFEADRSGKRPANQQYILRQPWMVSNHYLKLSVMHFFLMARPQIPGLLVKHIYGLVLNWLKPGNALSNFASEAVAIQFKRNFIRLRAFYLSSGNTNNNWCLKIVSNQHGIADGTRAELRIRKTLENLGSITIPKLIFNCEDNMFIYIGEEMIKGRRFRIRRDWKLFKDQGLKELSNTYRLLGFNYEPLKSHLPEKLIDNMTTILKGLPQGDSFLLDLHNAYISNIDVPVSLCHWDLLPSNLGIANGRLYFFDWEKSRLGPIFHDLMKLPMKYPSLSGRLIGSVFTVMKRDFSMDTLSLQHQFTAYTALRIFSKPDKTRVFLNVWERYISIDS